MFLLGRVFASGARLYIVAIPFALVAFGNLSTGALIGSIVGIAAIATAYTAAGGIRAVIWTDVLQAAVVIGTVGIAFVLLAGKIPLSGGEIVDALRTTESGDKLQWIDTSFDLSRPFTLWTALIGFVLFNLAAFGTDQDLTQRMLTCRSAKKGATSVIVSQLIGIPVVMLFMSLGLLLFVYYQRPELMGDAAPAYAIDDTRRVFLEFMLAELPSGLRGLLMAGLFAAAMSSLDSALNAMASSTVADFYRPLTKGRDAADAPRRELRVSRIAIVGWAIALAGFASLCVYWQRASSENLIPFALGVMVFAYAGLVGVFLTVLLTRTRGSERSAVAALVTGFVVVLALQDFTLGRFVDLKMAFPWKMTIASSASFLVCCLGADRKAASA